MSSRFETIIFDLDGTLVDTVTDVTKGVNRALEKMGFTPISVEQVKKAIGPGREEFIKAIFPGEENPDVKKFLTIFREYYWDQCLERTVLFDGMGKVLSQLDDRTLAVASNKPKAFTEKILQGLGVRERFKAVVGPEDVTHAKPHPEMIIKTLNVVGGKASRTLLVGDTDKDILAGRGAGVCVCGVLYGYGIVEDIENLNPDFLIAVPLELLDILKNSHD